MDPIVDLVLLTYDTRLLLTLVKQLLQLLLWWIDLIELISNKYSTIWILRMIHIYIIIFLFYFATKKSLLLVVLSNKGGPIQVIYYIWFISILSYFYFISQQKKVYYLLFFRTRVVRSKLSITYDSYLYYHISILFRNKKKSITCCSFEQGWSDPSYLSSRYVAEVG